MRRRSRCPFTRCPRIPLAKAACFQTHRDRGAHRARRMVCKRVCFDSRGCVGRPGSIACALLASPLRRGELDSPSMRESWLRRGAEHWRRVFPGRWLLRPTVLLRHTRGPIQTPRAFHRSRRVRTGTAKDGPGRCSPPSTLDLDPFRGAAAHHRGMKRSSVRVRVPSRAPGRLASEQQHADTGSYRNDLRPTGKGGAVVLVGPVVRHHVQQ